MNKMKSLQEFEQWLRDAQDDLDCLETKISSGIELDYSTESISKLGKWIVELYPEHDLIKEEESQKLVDALARYAGEVFRKKVGGNWFLELNEDMVYQGYIGIKGYEYAWNEATEIFPIAWVSAAIQRQDADFILRRIENHQKRA